MTDPIVAAAVEALRNARATVGIADDLILMLESLTDTDAEYLAALDLLWPHLPPWARRHDQSQSRFGNKLNSIEIYIDNASDDDVRAVLDKAIKSGETG